MTLRRARGQALEVADGFQGHGQRPTQVGRLHQLGDGPEAQLDRLSVSHRRPDPPAQPPGTDRRSCAIHHLDQGRELEVAHGGGVERHRRVRRVRTHREGAGGDAGLVLLQVVQHDAGRSDGERGVGGSDGGRKGDPQEVTKTLLPADGIEPILLDLRRGEQLGGREPLQLGVEALARELAEEQLAGGDLACRQAGLISARPCRDEVVRPRRIEVRVFHDRTGRQHSGHVAAHDLVLPRRLDLVADHDLVSRAQQLADVCLPGVVRHTAHGRPAALAKWS